MTKIAREVTLLEREQEALVAGPSHEELVQRVRTVVKVALATGTPRDEVLAALEALRTHDPDYGDVAPSLNGPLGT